MKNYVIFIGLLFLHIPAMNAVGGGLALYRVTHENDIEFLLVQDPFQRAQWRQGFEFPAGTIGDFGHTEIDQLDGKKIDRLSFAMKKNVAPVCYLQGAIREGLEELLFVPAMTLVQGHAYSNKKINKNFAKSAIDAVARDIKNQGLLCLRNIDGAANYTIFFWNVTSLPTKNWLQQMQSQRSTLLNGWFSRAASIGAEPDSFAWVSMQELKKVIIQAQNEPNIHRIKGTYCVVAKELVHGKSSLKRDVSIQLSPGFVGLISMHKQVHLCQQSMWFIVQLLENLPLEK